MAADVETSSVFSDTASDFSDFSRASTAATTASRTHLFTCLACHVAFRSADAQRDHMRTDWHRYNLKRKVAELPPVTAENFAARLEQQKHKNEEDETRNAFVAECIACRKTYSSQNAYSNHLGSKKHKDAQVRFNELKAKGIDPLSRPEKKASNVVSGVSSSSGSATAPQKNWRAELANATSQDQVLDILARKAEQAERLTELDCLFCLHSAQSFENNMEHMAKAHSFFIPDIEYLVDLKGLIKYLGEKVAVGHVCLYCNGKGRAMHSLEAVRKHMVDKGHCKILYEDGAELEIADFYDFSSTYPDEVAEEGEEGDGEWEDVEEGSDENEEEELGDLSESLGSIRISPDETQLILPSGVRLGHRQFNRFWRQNLKPEDSRDSVLIHRLVGQYKMLGYEATPYEQAVAAHQRRLEAKKVLYRNQEYKARVGIKHNMLQKHFRSQIGFGV
ncbi:uncharacterized protein SPPG_05447 [Spizellomyces punctatus DAOM BR117]|uniref:C2H2-type domain-containing protein n=1 Tax=Spizellomyces punctatus (strain DAOM BR117) TaxID=645134 RepID=A0A0L0HDV2_SPIPD|nr:uncharacterized protein SPPG_05447 [Spizellomyces punctatus DAOM BR117]KNC99191.1 hypothetical protein SPPG_05447 [Spizellomyces punctatus DAOM BR117]|eukprot:XP_016607231.1 hypothetical protein SPPG_05447 [Spizellomyces punctatus DAOM BR117]